MSYPYCVTAPLRTAATKTAARLILQSSSGGLYAGEGLAQAITAGPQSRVAIECPAATVVHGMKPTLQARQILGIAVSRGGQLRYLSRPLIFFPDAALEQRVVLRAAADATILYREGFYLHDARGGDRAFRQFQSSTQVLDENGALLALDRTVVEGAQIIAGIPGIGGAFRAFGSIYLIRSLDEADILQVKGALMAHFAGSSSIYASASALRRGCGLLVRVAARDGGALADALEEITARLANVFLERD
ncbi:urease accessory protein UreD [Labrys sedimenti]|uniref:urease accessory protein UreD n=1 Tax=Labrys sedimenti TaxID=3106036 RepID=UPI002ACA2514|nr:urease accessory protein UreD [Labrys sp. ZIDIC5]MDZ5453435.1 urease accessory protein UreD [Labrys sp. ZIDIC5]